MVMWECQRFQTKDERMGMLEIKVDFKITSWGDWTQ